MVIVLNEDVRNNAWFGRDINEYTNLYIKPFLEKNGQTDFRVALIELFDKTTEVRIKLNTDVLLDVEFNKPVLKPDDVGITKDIQIEDLKNITWTQDGNDGNSAKILVFQYNKDFWILDTDFRYNQENAKKILDRAFEFFLGSNIMLKATHYNVHVIIYLIWSTAELILDAVLALYAKRPESKTSHTQRIEKLKTNPWLFSAEFSTLLVEISNIKNHARYWDNDFTERYDKSFFEKQLEILEREIQEIEKII